MGKAEAANYSRNDRKIKSKMYHQRGRNQRGRGGQGNFGKRSYSNFGVGRKGFLCTTNFHEKDAVKEAFNLLNEYYNESDDVTKSDMAAQVAAVEGDPASSKPVDDDEEDIEASMKKEIEDIKDNAHRFKCEDTGVRNIIFISTTINDPVKLAHKILEDLTSKKEQKSRFLLRLIPIEAICRAEIPAILVAGKELFEKHLKNGCNSYQIIYKARYNNSVNREAIIKCLAEAVAEVNPMNVVNLTDPTFSIIVEVIKGFCCLSVILDFNKFRRYNLIEAADTDANKTQSKRDSKAPKEVKEVRDVVIADADDADGVQVDKMDVEKMTENEEQISAPTGESEEPAAGSN